MRGFWDLTSTGRLIWERRWCPESRSLCDPEVGPGGNSYSRPGGGFSAHFFAAGTTFVYRTVKAVIGIIWFDTAANALLELDVLQSIITPSKCNSRACEMGFGVRHKELSKRLRPIPIHGPDSETTR
jgi:hypothetical protein